MIKGRVICMVQTRPLPGTYRNRGERIDAITEQALEETRILTECGVQTVILQNMGDMPVKQQAFPETIAYLSVVASSIRRHFPDISLGVLVNWDGVAAMAVADAAGADFIRVEHLYTGAEVTSAGILQGQCCEITALKKRSAQIYRSMRTCGKLTESRSVRSRWMRRRGSACMRRLQTVCLCAEKRRREV